LSVYLTIGIGFTPSRLAVNAPKTFRNESLSFLLFMPNGSFGFSHHFVGADNLFIGQVQETVER
jgi:hypothetical protein